MFAANSVGSTNSAGSTNSSRLTADGERNPLLKDADQEPDISNRLDEKPGKKMNLLKFTMMCFFCVSGGAYGIEDSISVAWPLVTFLSYAIIPFVWSLPMGLMVAELSTMMPDNAGYILWVKKAFGPMMGFQNGFWGWFNTMADNALYPVMFTDYLESIIGELDWDVEYLIRLGFIISLTVINILGVDIVGSVSVLFAVLVLSPFVITFFWGLPYLDPSSWIAYDNVHEKPFWEWGLFISVVLWSTSGYDACGNVAGEIQNPKKNYPRSMIFSLLLSIASYVLPLAVIVSVDTDYDNYEEGYFPKVAGMVKIHVMDCVSRVHRYVFS